MTSNVQEEKIGQIPFITNIVAAAILISGLPELFEFLRRGTIGSIIPGGVSVLLALGILFRVPSSIGLIRLFTFIRIGLLLYYTLEEGNPWFFFNLIPYICILILLWGPGSKRKAIILGTILLLTVPMGLFSKFFYRYWAETVLGTLVHC